MIFVITGESCPLGEESRHEQSNTGLRRRLSSSGICLVRVRAQVMTRDDSTGGWVPMGGGGFSNVSVRKKPSLAEDDRNEYIILGQRITDQSVVLTCIIKRDFEYHKVMPTFHHWKTGDKKFGLTFQTAADAKAFDKGVRMAVEDLMEGITDPSICFYSDVGDDDVFMTLELPMERVESVSSSGSSTTTSGGTGGSDPTAGPTYTHTNHHYFHRMNFLPRHRLPLSAPATPNGSNNISITRELSEKDKSVKDFPRSESDKIEIIPGETYSYVQFSNERPSVHEYSYPVVGSLKSNCQNTKLLQQPPILPSKCKKKKDRRVKIQCRHCQELYSEDKNVRGVCEYSPDCVSSSVDAVTCINCARCMLYHCMADAEGDFSPHPCSCVRDEGWGRRWLGLTILSILVPCLWCYLPLKACHQAGIYCAVCGGRHEPS